MSSSPPKRIAVHVVTYREPFEETSACRSLLALPQALRQRLSVHVSCNGMTKIAGQVPAAFESREYAGLPHRLAMFSSNDGLAGGYNACLADTDFACVSGVLFLNADATVSEPFMQTLIEHHDQDPSVALAPTLISLGRTVSPFHKDGLDARLWIIGYLFLPSGTFLQSLQFPSRYWLDGIDYWLSVEMEKAGLIVRALPLTLSHPLSVSNSFSTLPAWRYANILQTEKRFYLEQRIPSKHLRIVFLRALGKCVLSGRWDLARVVMNTWRKAPSA